MPFTRFTWEQEDYQNLTVISYGEFENMLEVDSNQAVLYDIVHGQQL